MRWFLPVLGAFAFTVAATADEPKPAPTAAELKKQIADLDALIVKKKAERTIAEEQLKALAAEGKKLADARDKMLKEMYDAAEKTHAGPKAKALAEKENAQKVRKALKEFADAHDVLIAKYKAATDPKEQEELGKKITEEKAAFKDKLEDLKKAETVAKAAEDEYLKAVAASRAELDKAARAADEARLPLQREGAKVKNNLAQIQDDLDFAERDIRRLKDKLKELEK